MEEEQIISADETSSEESKGNGSSVNKLLVGIIVILLLVMTGGGAYLLGIKKGDGEESNVLPTQSLIESETLGEQDENKTTETASDEATISATPVSVAPSVTPKVTASPTLKIVNPNLKTEFKLLPTATPTPIPTLKFQLEPIEKEFSLP